MSPPLIETYSPGNHYVGTNRLGLDSGLNNGTAVVDLNTKVYGTDNLVSTTSPSSEISANFLQYIVDSSIHPDLPTGNIQTTVMVVAEAAVARIMSI
jgi:cellobiose dehydrogenase (acceptor)